MNCFGCSLRAGIVLGVAGSVSTVVEFLACVAVIVSGVAGNATIDHEFVSGASLDL